MELNKIKTFRNPYPGIRSFDENEGELFFGREKQIDELLEIILKKKFVAISGTSGSGKSSLVKAGLIPFLKTSDASWIRCILRPGNSPLRNFADALSATLRENGFEKDKNTNANNFERKMRESFDEFIKIIKSTQTNFKILIYIDQFEEIFRYNQNETIIDSKNDSKLFIDFIIYLVSQTKIPFYIVISLRSDFMGDCTEFRGLPELINKGHYLIPKMTTNDKEKAIEGPAKFSEIGISKELKKRLNDDIIEFDVNLPVLQHALMRTWEYRMVNDVSDKPLDVEHYESIGTVESALSVHAEQVFGTISNDKSKKLVEKIFKSLTDLGEDNRGIRRPARYDEICKVTGARKEEVLEIINLFRAEANSFLFPSAATPIFSDTIIDISHESIMFVWKRLQEWVREESESAQLYLRLSKSAEMFQEGKTRLLVNPDLQIALKWKKENEPNLEWAKRYNPAFERTITYIEYSKKEYDNKIALKEQKQRKSLKRARGIAIFLGTATLISLLFLMVSLNLKLKAEKSEKEAREDQKIAVKVRRIAEQKTKEAVSHKRIAEQQQLIAEQQRLFAEEQKKYAVEQKQEALYQKGIALIAKNDAVVARDKARNLQKIAEKLRDEAYEQKRKAEIQKLRAEVSEARTDTLRKIAIAKSLAIQAIRLFEANKKMQTRTGYEKKLPMILAFQAAYFNEEYKGNKYDPDIFSALILISSSKQSIRDKNSHSDGVRDIEVCSNPDGFVSCGEDGKIKLFEFSNINSPKTFNTEGYGETGFRTITIVENSNLLAAANLNGDILFLNLLSPMQKPNVLRLHTGIVNKIIYSGKNNAVYTCGNDGNVYSIDLENNFSSKKIFKTDYKITTISVNSNEDKLYIALYEGGIKVLDLNDNNIISEIQAENEKITNILFVNNEEFIISTFSGKIEIFKNNSLNSSVFAHNSGITDIKYDSINSRLITSSFDTKVKIWDYKNMQFEPITLSDHTSWVFTAAITKDNKKLITGSKDKSIVINKIDITELTKEIRTNVSQNMNRRDWLRYVGEGIEYSENLPE